MRRKGLNMAPKQPDWAFLESLTPDDLEEDDTEKVTITLVTILNLDHHHHPCIICFICISMSRCTSSYPPGTLVTTLTSEQLLPSCLSRLASPFDVCGCPLPTPQAPNKEREKVAKKMFKTRVNVDQTYEF